MKHNHPEAFCLMAYQAEGAPESPIEWIWNSRDGVTPFIVHSGDDDGVPLQHVEWERDIYAPRYAPSIGQRVFIDLTREAGERYLRARIDRQWESMSERWATPAEAYEALIGGVIEAVDKRQPNVVVADERMQRAFWEASQRKGNRT